MMDAVVVAQKRQASIEGLCQRYLDALNFITTATLKHENGKRVK